MVKLLIIEVVLARDDSRLLKMEKHINQHGAHIQAMRAYIKLIRDALANMKKELQAMSFTMYYDIKKVPNHIE